MPRLKAERREQKRRRRVSQGSGTLAGQFQRGVVSRQRSGDAKKLSRPKK